MRTVNALNEHGFTGICFARLFPASLSVSSLGNYAMLTTTPLFRRDYDVRNSHASSRSEPSTLLKICPPSRRRTQRHGCTSRREEITADSFFRSLQSQKETGRSRRRAGTRRGPGGLFAEASQDWRRGGQNFDHRGRRRDPNER